MDHWLNYINRKKESNMASKMDLKPCRDLIDSNFDGYKLSLDSLPVYSRQITNGIHICSICCSCQINFI